MAASFPIATLSPYRGALDEDPAKGALIVERGMCVEPKSCPVNCLADVVASHEGEYRGNWAFSVAPLWPLDRRKPPWVQ